MVTAKTKYIHSLLVSGTVLLVVIFLLKGIMRHFGIENFQDFQQFYKQFLQAQQVLVAYGYWVGYSYRTSANDATANVLNDFKRRVFQDSCEFRNDWPSNPAKMPSFNGAKDATNATIAYQAYIRCLRGGVRFCYEKLEDARLRFMKPGCMYKNPIDTSDPITVAFR